jgi:response regulator of citrate/malate metabolism
MQEPIQRNVRVLIAEDEQIQLAALKRDLDLIDANQRLKWGIKSFQSSLAGSVEKARDYLASTDFYDILILDLGLPQKEGGTSTPPENGQTFLESISKTKVKEVIIVSVFNEYDQVIKAVRKGAIDFIAKPYLRESLQARVMESWKRVLEKDSAHLLQDRVKELAHYNERGLAYSHTVCFCNFANDVIHKTMELEEHIDSRYGLSRQRDSGEKVIQILTGFETSVSTAKQKWNTLQVPSLADHEMHTTETVEPMLCKLEHSLLPCLIVKNVKLETRYAGETKISTFKNGGGQTDARAILKEILSGALADLPDYDTKQDESSDEFANLIRIEVSSENRQAVVKFTDNLQPISTDDAERINTGSFTVSKERFSRAWGLAVMQHSAVLGGGRLEVKPQEQGNIITYFIPLDSNA